MRTTRYFAFVGLLVASCGQTPSTTPPPLPPSAAISLEPSWPATIPDALVDELDRAAQAHTIFAIGEGDHYIHEKYAYRVALVRRLVAQHGLRHFAIEMGGSDAGRIDRYLETGDERWLERVALYGYSGETDDERRELAPVTHEKRRPCDDAWAEDERRFFRDLRALGATTGERIHLFGFDYDASPGGGYADARSALDACAASQAVLDIRPQLSPPRKTSADAEIERLVALVGRIDDERSALEEACGAAAVDQARDALDQLAFSYRTFFEWRASMSDRTADGPNRVRRMFAAREEGMFARFTRWRASLPSAAKVALFSHNLHAARDSEVLRYGLAPHDLPMWQSLGSRIERRWPGSVWVSWLLYGRGARYTPTKESAYSDVGTRADSLEAYLAATPGRSFILTGRLPAGSVIDRALPFGTETSEGAGPIRTSADAIVFLQTASPPPGCGASGSR